MTGRYDALAEEHGDDPADEIAAKLEQISDQIDALFEGTERWLPEGMARAGAVVGVGYEGKLAVERGLVRPEDEPAEQELVAGEHSSARAKKDASGLSDKLAEELTAHRTASLRMELANRTDIALTAVVHALALPMFFPRESASCLEISLSSVSLSASGDSIEASPAGKALDELHQSWQKRLPSSPEKLWDWLLKQDSHTRLDLLAYCAGCSVNVVKKRHEGPSSQRFGHADRLAAAVGLDMTHWWQPTAQSYFGHVPKARILDAVKEAVTPEAADNLSGMKKDACAAEAENRLAGTGWLPAILRLPADQVDPVAMAAE